MSAKNVEKDVDISGLLIIMIIVINKESTWKDEIHIRNR